MQGGPGRRKGLKLEPGCRSAVAMLTLAVDFVVVVRQTDRPARISPVSFLDGDDAGIAGVLVVSAENLDGLLSRAACSAYFCNSVERRVDGQALAPDSKRILVMFSRCSTGRARKRKVRRRQDVKRSATDLPRSRQFFLEGGIGLGLGDIACFHHGLQRHTLAALGIFRVVDGVERRVVCGMAASIAAPPDSSHVHSCQ